MEDKKLINLMKKCDDRAFRLLVAVYRDAFLRYAKKYFSVGPRSAGRIFHQSLVTINTFAIIGRLDVDGVSLEEEIFKVGKRNLFNFVRNRQYYTYHELWTRRERKGAVMVRYIR